MNSTIVRPNSHPKTVISVWNKPKDKAIRNVRKKETLDAETLPLRATAKQSADNPKAIMTIERKSIFPTD